ncbi:MAG: hypothetical protein JNM58_00920 [Xanthomonadaceae bacterium]|nr:hypothetical protein [Xanthomonadaceae bacterium]
MATSSEILERFDKHFDAFELPCFGNMNIDYVGSRLSIYQSEDGLWACVIDSVVWWPAADGLMGMIELVGPGVIGAQGFDNDRTFDAGRIHIDDDGDTVVALEVRGKPIANGAIEIKPDFELQGEAGFWATVALHEKFRTHLLATESEIQRFLKPGLPVRLRLDAWHHPDFDMPPSLTETFIALSESLSTQNFLDFPPCRHPNSNWASWHPK